MLQLTIWSAPSFLAMLVAAIAYQRVANNEVVPGVHAIRWLFIGIALWSLGQLMATLFTQLQPKLLASQLQYLGIVITPVAWFTFAMNYAHGRSRMSWHSLALLSVIPALTLLLVVTNSWHHWIWKDLALTNHSGYWALKVSYGPWFRLNVIYSYALIFAATSILAFVLSQSHRHRSAFFAVIAAPMVVSAFNILYLSPWNPIPWLDPTPLSFAIAALILHKGVLTKGLLDLVPIMRHRVVEELKDPVIIVNERGRILDLNPAAVPLQDGEDLTQRVHTSQGLIHTLALEKLISQRDANTEITLHGKAYDVSASPLDPTNPERGDIVLVFRDVTRIRAAEQSLRRVHEDLEKQANQDQLTKLYNRHYFMKFLEDETERVRRYGSTLSVLLFDLDHFKRINDSYGHDVGDEVLCAVAEVTQKVKRVTDVAARLGGEEFCILLPETDEEGAVRMGRRLCKMLESKPIRSKHGPTVKVTASVGVATVSNRGNALDNLLSHADKALYRAKDGGRNMVCSARI